MSRYIDADKLIEELKIFNDFPSADVHFINGIKMAIGFVKNVPTADVEEVKYARWRCVDESDNVYMCDGENGCGGEIILNEGTPIDNAMIRCPLCGARMQKEKEE